MANGLRYTYGPVRKNAFGEYRACCYEYGKRFDAGDIFETDRESAVASIRYSDNQQMQRLACEYAYDWLPVEFANNYGVRYWQGIKASWELWSNIPDQNGMTQYGNYDLFDACQYAYADIPDRPQYRDDIRWNGSIERKYWNGIDATRFMWFSAIPEAMHHYDCDDDCITLDADDTATALDDFWQPVVESVKPGKVFQLQSSPAICSIGCIRFAVANVNANRKAAIGIIRSWIREDMLDRQTIVKLLQGKIGTIAYDDENEIVLISIPAE